MGLPPQTEPLPPRAPAERAGLVVTNLIKLGGLIVAINEALIEPTLRPGALGLAALMMAGAQSLEAFLTSFFGSRR